MQVGLPTCIPDSHLYRVTYTRCHIGTVISPDDGHIVARNMSRKAIDILRKSCAPSWFYLQDSLICFRKGSFNCCYWNLCSHGHTLYKRWICSSANGKNFTFIHWIYISKDIGAEQWRLCFAHSAVNLLAQEFYIYILAHPVCKMWIIQEPKKVALWNKRHFEEKKRRVCSMFKILSTYICWKKYI